ncbi:FAD-dependent monooxygenase [Fibrella forsythiae]|uniref:FAD-dependent monooxygenase n=1 Tax=Fibrella forsythiae TaxID=2817061 RepID=A0ABS3JHS9_9BACT|nr:FAD-dependent monooxygenase [Fibrella forsythiae]MBO0949569.1 FAD-dependent monooxygenase [Fibrella forsythiae]
MQTALKTDVLIIGAGPTGLSLAAQLGRFGIDCLIVDQKEGTTELSKAMVVHARTMEIFDQLGLAQQAIAHGSVVQQVTLLHEGNISARLNFADIGGQLSPFPFVLVFEQSKTERLLYDHLRNHGKDVRWQTGLTSLTQSDEHVLAELQEANGTMLQVEARYVVGCDGASSTTRHLTGLGFEGSTNPRLFYVADVDMEFEAEPMSFYGTFGGHSFMLMFPMEGEKRWRLIGNVPEYDTSQTNTISHGELEIRVKTLIKRPLDITNVRWLSTYKVHTRHAERFSAGRCFLAGDAAHVHTPAGGQGMNTGIQDAYNLAWKMAFVLNGYAQPSLLDTYSEERLANAKNLLKSTDQLFDIASADNWYIRFFRDNLFPTLAGLATQFDATRAAIFPTISMIGINYRDSSLSQHYGDQALPVKAGDRMPYFLVDGVGVYDRLTAPTFHLLLFSDGSEEHRTLEKSVRDEHSNWLDVSVIPLYPRVVELFGVDKPFAVLLRPDNHIATLSLRLSAADIRAYLTHLNPAAATTLTTN